MMDENLEHILRNTLYPHGYNAYQMEGNVWAYNADGLRCLTCDEESDRDFDIDEDDDRHTGISGDKKHKNNFAFSNFKAVTVDDFFKIDIVQGDDYDVIVMSDDDILENVNMSEENETLMISMDDDYRSWMKRSDQVSLFISMPELKSLELGGTCESRVSGFDDAEMYVELSGASYADINVNSSDLQVNLDGASKMDLSGSGGDLRLNVSGAASFKGFDYEVQNAKIESSGMATIRINAVGELILDMAGASHVRYMGSPQMITNRSKGTTLTQE